jgi:hypothetical protein
MSAARLDASPAPDAGVGASGARLRGSFVVLGGAVAIGFVQSLQFLTQPFLWRHWPLDEILVGWLFVLRDNLIFALVMTPGMVAAVLVPVRSRPLRAAMVGLAAFVGAGVGELVLGRFAGETIPLGHLAGHALRWAIVGVAVTAVVLAWRREQHSRQSLREEIARRIEFEQQNTQARLAALQTQIEPHLLFNTLGTVRQLQRIAPETGASLLTQFLEYLRRMLSMQERTTVPLGEELDLVRSYLAVLQARDPNRLEVSFEVDDRLRMCEIPSWSVSTLVENAIKHGIGPLQRTGSLRIVGAEHSGRLCLDVVDDGVGLGGSIAGGAGIGLSNLRARLDALYGHQATLRVGNESGGGVRASLSLPCRVTGRTP